MKFGVLTIQKAAEEWRLHPSTINRAIKEGRFRETEYERQKGIYLVSAKGMKRVFGDKKGGE